MLKILLTDFRLIYALLPQEKRRQSLGILLLLLLSSVLDLAGLSALIPLFLVVLDPTVFEPGKLIGDLFMWTGFETQNAFIILFSSLIFFVVIIKNGLGLLIQFVLARFSFSIQQIFSIKLFEKYFNRGLLFIKSSNSNSIARDVNGVPGKFSTELLLPLLNLTNELIVISIILIGLLLYNPYVVLMVFAIVLPTFVLFYGFAKNRVQFYAEKMYEISPRISRTLFESFFGFVDVKVSNTENKFLDEYRTNLKESLHYTVLNQTFRIAPTKVVETSMILGILVLICFGLYYYEDKNQLLTLLSVFALAAYRTLPSANRLMVSMIQIRAHQYTLDVLNRIHLELPEEEQEELNLKFEKQIQMKDLSFSFETETILKNVSLNIRKGERLGIVGKSGSGKSTLMNLLLLFYPPKLGSLYCDDVELTVHRQRAWRKLIGYVPQDVFLNDGTLRENVAFGIVDSEIDDEKVETALERASLGDLLKDLPDGIHSRIGERGSKLSGGQRQRVGIARALYHGAEVLLFDEATSALDNQTEKEITDSIGLLSDENITMVIIAHRVSTLKHCSRILEMEDGIIKGEYTYDELIREVV